MKKNINVTIDFDIYDKLLELAKERGINAQELLRWIIGDYIRYSNPSRYITPVSSVSKSIIPEEYQTSMKDITKLSKMMPKTIIGQGTIKCSNCTFPLTMEAIEEGKCQSCGTKI